MWVCSRLCDLLRMCYTSQRGLDVVLVCIEDQRPVKLQSPSMTVCGGGMN